MREKLVPSLVSPVYLLTTDHCSSPIRRSRSLQQDWKRMASAESHLPTH